MQAAAQEQVSIESILNDTRSRNDHNDEDTDEIPGTLQRKVSELIRERYDLDMSATELAVNYFYICDPFPIDKIQDSFLFGLQRVAFHLIVQNIYLSVSC